jgi:dolichyl-phosphate-mannose-protein mannosyltransferase/PA14 domain-containing protein
MKHPRGAGSLGMGMLAVGLAGWGEAVIRSKNFSGLGGALYFLGIVLFAIGAWPLPSAPGGPSSDAGSSRVPSTGPSAPIPQHSQNERRRNSRWRGMVLLIGAMVLAIGTNVAMLSRLRRGNESATTVTLWLSSVAVLLLAGILGGEWTAWAPRWSTPSWPRTRRSRLSLVLILILLLAIAALSRFRGLDRVPYGINADEGDRAAVAIQIVRGQNATSVFGTGWYHLSMVYFKLLALIMRFSGLNFAGARVFGAICGLLTVAILTFTGIRHFGWRTGLMTGAIFSVLGVALQFSRETTEAAPTATLWTLSAALFLEAARSGKAWAWIGAGIAGGASVYFYPTGRLWAVLAAFFCLYVLLRGPQRRSATAGVFLAALAALAIASPYLLHVWQVPNDLTVRAHETSIFIKENPLRLTYYQPTWSLGQLIKAQIDHSIGIFNKYNDGNFFWPAGRPILPPALAALTLLGLGSVTLRMTDPRLFLLSIWFWVGFVGVIVTVETPNLQRMATAVPLLGLLPALVLDDLARRAESVPKVSERFRLLARRGATAAAALAACVLAWREGRFYFGEYAAMDPWPYPRIEGKTVADAGKDGWAISLGYQFHMVNSGWVRLLAPFANRAGVLSPGSHIPLTMPADRDLAFIISPGQSYYLPYIAEVLPGGSVTRVTHPPGIFMYSVYRVPKEAWARQQGALAFAQGSPPVRVAALGEPPPGWTRFPSPMRWSAALRVNQYWNYGFRVGPGPARLVIDGKEVLKVPAGEASAVVNVGLARGDHGIQLEGVVKIGQAVLFEWALLPAEKSSNPDSLSWQKVPTERLRPTDRAPEGLFGIIRVPDRSQHRLDSTIATGGLCEEVHSGGPFEATWRGTLNAPKTGSYEMALRAAGGVAELRLDGRSVVQSDGERDELVRSEIALDTGPHAIELTYHVRHAPGGIEWIWKPPGGSESIVPPSVLSPPPGAGIDSQLPFEVLGDPESQPVDKPTHTTP